MKFTQKEINELITDYNNGVCLLDLSEKYNRDSGTIIGKLKSLGIYKPKNYRYTKEDIEFLKIYYPLNDWDSIMKKFKNVSKQSIINKCHKLGIKSVTYFWSDEDVEYLISNYYISNIDDLYEYFNQKYSKNAIITKAVKLGMSKNRNWSTKELDLLRKYYSTKSYKELDNLLPNRSWGSIVRMANNLKLVSYHTINNYWNKSQTKLLLNNWETLTDIELSNLIGKSIESVKWKRWAKGLIRCHHYGNFSYKSLQKYLRGKLTKWKTDTIKNCDYKCFLTGSKDFAIHHIVSFNIIFNEFLEENKNFIKCNISDYTEDKLNILSTNFINVHNRYPLGVCIRKDLHNEFHRIFGDNNNEEQLEKFKIMYYKNKINIA